MMDTTIKEGLGAVVAAAGTLEHVSFAAIIFMADDALTLVWQNEAHARMAGTVGRSVINQGLFEAFPPGDAQDADAAMAPIRQSVARVSQTGVADTLGPYRFDIIDPATGEFAEHHWRMEHAPIKQNGEVVAILQTSSDVTQNVLSQSMADASRRLVASADAVNYFSFNPDTDELERHGDIDEIFGFAPGEAGASAAALRARVADQDRPAFYEWVSAVLEGERGAVCAFDCAVLRPSGDQRFVRVQGAAVTDPIDRMPRIHGTITDLTDLEKDRQDLTLRLETRKALLREANHRIKNSLQIVSSVLNMERRKLTAAETVEAADVMPVLTGIEARIRAIANMHGLLQDDNLADEMPADFIVKRLVEVTRVSFDLTEEELAFTPSEAQPRIDSDSVIAVGVVMNELLTNAIKYGVAEDGETCIAVHDCSTEEAIVVIVKNHVPGRGDQLAKTHSSGMGTRIMDLFTGMLGATVEVDDQGHTFRATLTLPVAAT
ncbi:sensor histidine kinase [Pseudaestuariivita sp.]|uniref:sensor histidine kinase n=1 Tax=Pseudaestuariivita sp. TaxID=2211669 RepID=UPI004057EC30